MDTLEYLRKFLAGQINRQEKQLLEKSSLDDEFLGDALEGLELYQKKDGRKVLTRLSSLLDQQTSIFKVGSSRIIKLWPYAAAASVILLLTFTFWLRREGAVSEGEEFVAVFQEGLRLTDENSQDITQSDLAIEEKLDAHTEKLESFKPEIRPEDDESKIQKSLIVPKDQGMTDLETPPLASASQNQPAIPEIDQNNKISEIATVPLDIEETTTIVTPADAVEAQSFEAPSNKLLRSQARINENSPPVNASSDKMNTITSRPGQLGISPALLRIDSSNAYPEIGLQKLDDLSRLYAPKEEDFFMRGIQKPYSVSVEFQVDLNGLPYNISVKPDPGDWITKPVVNILEKSGKWIVPFPDYTIKHIFVF